MSTRMLIDARHPEETRVAVATGNRIEGKVRAALGLRAEGASEPSRESALAESEVAEIKAA